MDRGWYKLYHVDVHCLPIIIDVFSFLGYVDLLGTTYQASTLATGYGAYIAQPLLRKAVEGREHVLTKEEGIAILDNAMKVLFYRDARSINKVRALLLSLVKRTADQPLSVPNRDCDQQGRDHFGVA